jgi:hypothetical protein
MRMRTAAVVSTGLSGTGSAFPFERSGTMNTALGPAILEATRTNLA